MRRSARCAPLALAAPPALAATLALAVLLAPTPLDAQTVTLRGEVLDRNGQPAEGVRLVIVGHPPEVAVRDGGAFSHPLAGSPSEVTLRVIGEPGVEVLFPPAGRVPVPRDPEAVVPVVVGAPIDAVIRDRVDADIRAIRETLAVRGVAEDRIEETVAAEMRGLAARIEELTRDAVAGAVAGAEQVELRDRLNRHLRQYVRTAGDLVRVFELMDPDRELGAPQFQRLYQAMERYSQAYAALDSELGSTPAAVGAAWPGEVGSGARRELERILELVEAGFHRDVLGLTRPLEVIQREYLRGDKPRDQELRAAKRAVAEARPGLDEQWTRLDAAVSDLLAALGAAGS